MGNGEWEIEKWEIVVSVNTTHKLESTGKKLQDARGLQSTRVFAHGRKEHFGKK